jgi:hypothetical protein
MLYEFLIRWYDNRQDEDIYLVPVGHIVDTENNWQSVTDVANARNNTQIQRSYAGVHPAGPGYYQMADALYAFLKCMET